MAAPSAGLLIGWLTDDAGKAYKMGTVTAGSVTQFQDLQGRDLLGLFSGALVTVEETDTVTEPGVITLKGTLPASLLTPGGSGGRHSQRPGLRPRPQRAVGDLRHPRRPAG